MSVDIIVHIGPPKTATTSLQLALEQACPDQIAYGGTFQPRARNTQSLSDALYWYCAGAPFGWPDLAELQDRLRCEVAAGKTVLLSEEMLLVERDFITVADILRNLSRVVDGFRCRIVITARKGALALPSYYQEIHSSLPLALKFSFDAFCQDRRAACYDYSALCRMLQDAGLHDIRLIDFDALVAGQVDLGALTGCAAFDGVTLPIAHENSGRTGTGTGTRTGARLIPAITLRHLGQMLIFRRLSRYLRVQKWPGYGAAMSVMDRIILRKAQFRDLVVPAEVTHNLTLSHKAAMAQHGPARLKAACE